jgi:putative SOS response-associated peptidase YedK
MCGRFLLTNPGDVLAEAFGLDEPPEVQPRYNIAPSQLVDAVVSALNVPRRHARFRWGLIAPWARPGEKPKALINARAETLAERASFRTAFRRRRCIVMADGFYEWKAEGRSKRPHLIRMSDARPFGIAGLWNPPSPTSSETTCTLVTTAPNELVAAIHDRMPVILQPAALDLWLDATVEEPDELSRLLTPFPADGMVAWEVGAAVNNPRVDDASCVERRSGSHLV